MAPQPVIGLAPDGQHVAWQMLIVMLAVDGRHRIDPRMSGVTRLDGLARAAGDDRQHQNRAQLQAAGHRTPYALVGQLDDARLILSRA